MKKLRKFLTFWWAFCSLFNGVVLIFHWLPLNFGLLLFSLAMLARSLAKMYEQQSKI